MARRSYIGLCGLALALLLAAAPAWAQAVKLGQAAPGFKLESGDEKPLSLADLKGKVVVVFYEKRDQVEINRALKKELNAYKGQQDAAVQKAVARVPVVDCSEASWITRGFWRDGLKENSQKEGVTIYGDWDGAMRQAYGLPQDRPSFLIIGPKGKIVCLASGPIAPEEFAGIKKVLQQATPR